ncbi:MAG: alpha/beta fold hydrolase [Bacillota bacterium]
MRQRIGLRYKAGLRFTTELLILALLALMLSACSKPAAQPPDLTDAQLDERARTFLRFMAEDKPEDAVKMMESRMATAMPAAKAAETWQTLVGQAGAFDRISGTRMAVEAGYRCVYVTCKFEKAAVDAKVVFDAAGKVTGLWFGPSQAEAPSYNQPAYADTSAFSETECVVGTSQWKLPGTLSMPKGKGPFPAVVLIHGSGANDRDETVGPNKPFKDLAWGLASRGIAVLRYEKRTKQYPAETSALMETFTVKEEVLDDALSAVALLKETEGVDPDRVYVLGHSLGASLAPRIGAEAGEANGESSVAGLIMLAPNARDLSILIEEQVQYIASLDGSVDDTESAEIARVKGDMDKVRDGRLQAGEVVMGASKAYWDDIMAYNPVETAKSLNLPMLILQGERDYQVTMEDFGLWEEALEGKDGTLLKSFPALNHLFIPGEGKSAPAEYQNPGIVDPAVIDIIATWLSEEAL